MSIGLGFIGAGAHARHHVKEFGGLLGADLVGIFDIDPSRADLAARDFPPLRATPTLDALLSDPAVQAVIIATPAETHKDLTLAALSAGKDVLVEKPMAHTPADARAMLDAAEASPDRILMVGHCERFNSAYVDARKAVALGHVGTPRFAQASRIAPMHLGDTRWVLGVLDTAVHDIDVLLWLVGDRVMEVSAQGVTVRPDYPIPDHVTYTLRFDNGALAQGHSGWVPFSGGYPMIHNAHPRLFLAGTDGILDVNLRQRPVSVHTHSTGGYFWPDDVLVGYGDYFTEVRVQDYAFLRAVSERTPSPVPARESYGALRVTHAAHLSLTERGGAPVRLDE